jgi:hypothetical protein
MSGFADQMLLQFSQSAFVTDFLQNQIGLPAILNTSYQFSDFTFQTLTLDAVTRTELEALTLQTIRVKGTEEQISPNSVRMQMTREFQAQGRLAWVDVLLGVSLRTGLQDDRTPIDSITTQQLLDTIGGAATLDELKTKLIALYSQDIVSAMFQRFGITTIDEFKQRLNLMVTFLFKAPAAFDPANPANSHLLPTKVCVNFQPDLNVAGALQSAKLSRAILDDETSASPVPEGIDLTQQHVFITVFPDGVAVDNAIPGLTAAAIKTGVQGVFAAEGMIAHFFV